MPGYKHVHGFGTLLNPWFTFKKSFLWFLRRYKYRVCLRYAVERENDEWRYAVVYYHHICYCRNEQEARDSVEFFSKLIRD